MNVKILVVDDEINMRKILSAILEREGYRVKTASDGKEAMKIIEIEKPHLIITDLKMPEMDGMKLLKNVTSLYPSIPVVILTAYGTVDSAVEALKQGAFDYMQKPFEQEEVKNVVKKAIATWNLNIKEIYLTPSEIGKFQIVGLSPKMQEIYRIINKVAVSPATILITGETGTGKELLAYTIHNLSNRKDKPFIKINCAAIPENLIESDLFGYEKGAYTGAITSKPGRFELADQGTLFLDEIGEIPKETQVKLLQFFQEQRFERVGGIKTIQVDVRLITATNADLLKKIKEGTFREDLYYRLNVVSIHLPPLRERKEDIPLLVNHFIEKFRKLLKSKVNSISEKALEKLIEYSWPGNIRELENVVERAVIMSESDKIELSDLPPEISKISLSSYQRWELKDKIKETTLTIEKEMIIKALNETKGNITKSAKLLGISRKGLQLKMKELGLNRKSIS